MLVPIGALGELAREYETEKTNRKAGDGARDAGYVDLEDFDGWASAWTHGRERDRT